MLGPITIDKLNQTMRPLPFFNLLPPPSQILSLACFLSCFNVAYTVAENLVRSVEQKRYGNETSVGDLSLPVLLKATFLADANLYGPRRIAFQVNHVDDPQ